jgi:hypothetical protein
VGAPIRPEARQIGRRPAIDALFKQVFEIRAHTLMFAERRVGKTSMAWAVLDRVRAGEAGWAIEVNLSRGPVITSEQFALRLAEQARAAGVRVDPAGEQIKDRLGDAATGARIAAKLAKLFGLEGADDLADAAEVGDTIDQALSSQEEEPQDLRAVLTALRGAAAASGRPVVVFVDEAQRICTDWANDDEDSRYTQEALAEVMEDPDGDVVLLLAGSDREGFERLFADGQPLHQDGMSFAVAPIDPADWHHELPLRFGEVGLEVGPDQVEQILAASGGHPQRTMRVCSHVRRLADGNIYTATDALVGEAIDAARAHQSWTD